MSAQFSDWGCRILAWDMEPKPRVQGFELSVQDPAHAPSLPIPQLQQLRPPASRPGHLACAAALAPARGTSGAPRAS